MRHWAEQYVGTPYTQFDCAGLCKQVVYAEFGKIIDLPVDRPVGIRNVSDTITNLQKDFAELTTSPEEGDAVLMIGKGRINHIGIFCRINGQDYVLHAMRNTGSTVLHNLVDLPDLGLTVEGFYRWL